MTILTATHNGGNLSTDGLTTHCYFTTEPIFDVLCAFGEVSAQSPWSGTSDIGFPIFWRTEPKQLAFRGNSGVRQLAGCIQDGSRKLAVHGATKEPGIWILKSGLPYTPIRLERVATVHDVGRGAYHSTEWYIRNLLRWGRWLVWGAMRKIPKGGMF